MMGCSLFVIAGDLSEDPFEMSFEMPIAEGESLRRLKGSYWQIYKFGNSTVPP